MLNNIFREESYDGYEIYKVKIENKMLYLGSKYNMKKYIDTIQNNIKKTSRLKSIVIFGSGNGVWFEGLDDITQDKEIIIVEPNSQIYELMKKGKFQVRKNNIKIIGMDSDDFYKDLLSVIDTSKVSIYIFANYDFVYRESFKEFINKIKDVIVDKQVLENTAKSYSKVWFENYLENLPQIIKADYINNYKNIFEGKTAIIVSAGPSLDKNIRLLKENEDKFIIIAAGRALKALKRENITADFTAIIDGSEQMYRVFEDSLENTIPLLFCEQSTSDIVKEYTGKKIFFSTREFINADKAILKCNPIRLFQGGSVSHACIDFARVLGCNTIILVGQDLAYTDNKRHGDKASAHFENNKIENETEYYVKGVKEEKVKTNFDFNIFRERIEMMIKLYNNITFINATEGGAHINGTIEMDLKDVIKKYNESIDKTILMKDFKIDINKCNVIDNLNNIYNDIGELIILSKKAIKINSELLELFLKSNKKYTKALAKLDYIDNKIKEKNNTNYLFETLISEINYDIVNKFSEEQYTDVLQDNIKKVSEKGKFLNKKLIEAFTYGKPLIKKCIEKLEEM